MVFAIMPAAAFAENEPAKTPVDDVKITVSQFNVVDGVNDGTVDISKYIKEGGAFGEITVQDDGGVMEEIRTASNAGGVNYGIYYKFKNPEGLGENTVTAVVPVNMPEDSEFENYTVIIRFAEKVEVSFDPNGGGGSMESTKVAPGTEIEIPVCRFTAPEGMEFDSWDLGKPGDKYKVEDSTVFKAQWKEIKMHSVTATYDYNDGKTGAYSETKTVPVGKAASFTAVEAPGRSGYNFLGWEFEGQLIKAGESFTAEADLTLTAKWEQKPLKTYTVVFDANGGKGAPASQSAESRTGEASITLTKDEPSRDGMKFMGWSLSRTDGKVILKPGEVAVVNDRYPTITLYAVWVDPSGSPKTGDESSTGLWAALMAASAVSAGAVITVFRKKHNS